MPRLIPPCEGQKLPIARFEGWDISGKIDEVKYYDTKMEAWRVMIQFAYSWTMRTDFGQQLPVGPIAEFKTVECWIHLNKANAWQVGTPKLESIEPYEAVKAAVPSA